METKLELPSLANIETQRQSPISPMSSKTLKDHYLPPTVQPLVKQPARNQPLEQPQLLNKKPNPIGLMNPVIEMVGGPDSREVQSSQRSFLLTPSQTKNQHKLERYARTITQFITQNWFWIKFIFIIIGLALLPMLAGPIFM